MLIELPENWKELVNLYYGWREISIHYELPEEFILKYKNEVCWICVLQCQKLSEKFIKKYVKKDEYYHLLWNNEISRKIKRKYNLENYIYDKIFTKRLFFRQKFLYI